MELIKSLIKKHEEFILYAIFGGLTSVVNFSIKFLLYGRVGEDSVACTTIAFVVAVLFAFFADKIFVFKNLDFSFMCLVKECASFFGCRIGTGLFDILFTHYFADIKHYNFYIVTLISSLVVIVINYVASKFFVFKK